ncbi:MAG: hypothetical protein JWM82_2507, partial [Myxococcales bacterium]|nr:hypothetical protein [Myxococcales bacterium]
MGSFWNDINPFSSQGHFGDTLTD